MIRRFFIFCFFVLLSADAGLAGEVFEVVGVSDRVGIGNDFVRVEFSRVSGELLVLKNVVTGDNYLKSDGGEGNIFRAYVDTTEVPIILKANIVCPPEGALGGQIIDPVDCVLEKSFFRKTVVGGVLGLVMYNGGTGLRFDLQVELLDGDFVVKLNLAVRNKGKKSRGVMVAVPYMTGLCLGEDGEKNLGVRLRDFGQSRAPAWELGGDLYGRGWNGQWDAVYDKGAGEALGLLTTGSLAAPFWAGVVLVALLIPLGLELANWGKEMKTKAMVGAVLASSTCVVLGGLVLRAVITIGGQS